MIEINNVQIDGRTLFYPPKQIHVKPIYNKNGTYNCWIPLFFIIDFKESGHMQALYLLTYKA
jgi:hypothetical protein